MSKICSKCKLEKPIERFSKRKDGKDGYRKWCKDCAVANSLQQRRANPIKYKEIDRISSAKNSKRRQATDKQWRKDNPDLLKNRTLMRLYNITLSEYNSMFVSQGGCCAICKIHQDKLKIPLCVDHCHNSKKVRGLLCRRCNSGIGFLNDDKQLVANALKYLHETE